MNLGDLLKRMGEGIHQVGGKKPKGFKYASIYEYVASEGAAFESSPLTANEWQTIRENVLWDEIKQCFANCQQVLFRNPKQPFDYVEGYVIGEIAIPIHHA